MSYKNKSLMTKKRAFTLVELLIVIAIIGILFIVLISKVDFATDKAKATGVQTDFRSFQMAFDTVAKENAGFNTFGWDTGDLNANGKRDSYDEGDTNKDGIQNGTEVFTGHKVYAETFTKVYSLVKPGTTGYDRDALNRLETAINANLDPKLYITIADDGTITMANGAQDPWNKEYHGWYITNAEVDKKDRGAIIMYSDGANNEFGSEHKIANGVVAISIPGNNKFGKDDMAIVSCYTYVNGYGEVKNSTIGFSNNQSFLSNSVNNNGDIIPDIGGDNNLGNNNNEFVVKQLDYILYSGYSPSARQDIMDGTMFVDTIWEDSGYNVYGVSLAGITPGSVIKISGCTPWNTVGYNTADAIIFVSNYGDNFGGTVVATDDFEITPNCGVNYSVDDDIYYLRIPTNSQVNGFYFVCGSWNSSDIIIETSQYEMSNNVSSPNFLDISKYTGTSIVINDSNNTNLFHKFVYSPTHNVYGVSLNDFTPGTILKISDITFANEYGSIYTPIFVSGYGLNHNGYYVNVDSSCLEMISGEYYLTLPNDTTIDGVYLVCESNTNDNILIETFDANVQQPFLSICQYSGYSMSPSRFFNNGDAISDSIWSDYNYSVYGISLKDFIPGTTLKISGAALWSTVGDTYADAVTFVSNYGMFKQGNIVEVDIQLTYDESTETFYITLPNNAMIDGLYVVSYDVANITIEVVE